MKVLPNGEVLVVAGTGDEYPAYSQTIGGESSDVWRVLLIRYSSDGTVLSQSTFGPSNNQTDWAGEAISIAANGDVMLGVDDGGFGFLRLSARS